MSDANAASDEQSLLSSASGIVAAYVSNNSVPADEVPNLLAAVHLALVQIKHGAVAELPAAQVEPAVPVKRSVQKDHIVCLEDGKKFKSLRRHLQSEHGMSPEAYRAKWNLPRDYPMVAPDYAATRSELAKSAGLGRRGAPAKAAARGRKKS